MQTTERPGRSGRDLRDRCRIPDGLAGGKRLPAGESRRFSQLAYRRRDSARRQQRHVHDSRAVDASCPDTDGTQLQFWSWYVHIYVAHQDGIEANFQSIVYVGTEDSGTNITQGMVVQMAPGLSTETFQVRVSLICGGQEQVIGSPSVTLTRCDPDAYNRAQREYDMAEQLAALGEKELAQAEESDSDLNDETATVLKQLKALLAAG